MKKSYSQLENMFHAIYADMGFDLTETLNQARMAVNYVHTYDDEVVRIAVGSQVFTIVKAEYAWL